MLIKRKILGYAYSKLLTLPSFWVQLQGLKTGDTIAMEFDDNNNLIIRGKNGTHKAARKAGKPTA